MAVKSKQDQQIIPPWGFMNPHVQTIAASFIKKKHRHIFKRERIDTPDGDFLDIDYFSDPVDSDRPMVLILHGLEGSSKAPYVQALVTELKKSGFNAVCINMRMCSGEMNRRPETYHSGKTEDLDYAISCLMNKASKIFAVGYSIGGNILLKWLGEKGSDAAGRLAGAVAVSVPYDLREAVRHMDRGFNRNVYTRLLLRSLIKKARVKAERFPGTFDFEAVRKARTFTEFDNLVTAPLNGFKDAMDYWTTCSSRFYLDKVRVPSLLIHSADDPFFTGDFMPFNEIEGNSHLSLILTKHGGHIGFLDKRDSGWLENMTVSALKNSLREQ